MNLVVPLESLLLSTVNPLLQTHQVPSTTSRPLIHHHRLTKHLYRIHTAVLTLASTKSSHDSCHPSLTPLPLSKEVSSYLAISSQTQYVHPTVFGPKRTPWSRAYLIHFIMYLINLINTHCGGYRHILDAHCPRGTCDSDNVRRLSVRATIVRSDPGLCV